MADPLGAQGRLLLGGGVPGPVAVQPGELLVDRGVLGVELERLLVVDLGILEAAGLAGRPRELQDALRGSRHQRHGDGDDADQGHDHEQPREDQQRFPANGHRAILLWLETPYRATWQTDPCRRPSRSRRGPSACGVGNPGRLRRHGAGRRDETMACASVVHRARPARRRPGPVRRGIVREGQIHLP